VKKAKAEIPVEQMADLRLKGVGLAEIGKVAGITKQAVSQALKRSGVDPQEIETFRAGRAGLLALKQKLILAGITPAKVEKMGVKDAAISYGILYDKERLETGQSTSNVANIHSIAQRVIERVSRPEYWADAEDAVAEPLPEPRTAIETFRAVVEKEKAKGGDDAPKS
jgi:hypothetical protein